MSQNVRKGVMYSTLQLLMFFACFALGMLLANIAWAQGEDFPPLSSFSLDNDAATQQEEAAKDEKAISDNAELPLEEQKALVNAIYNATKSTKTQENYTSFLAQCHAALAKKLSSENREYVTSLIGWALNRRAEKRFELAVQLKSIENLQHVQMMELALKDFNQSVISDPKRHRSWMSRGIAHVESGNYDQAISDFTNVIKLKPDSSNGWFNRAESLYERSKPANFPETPAEDDKTAQSSPEEILKLQTMGYEQAVADYDVVLRLNSDDTQALTGRGHANFALGKYDLALADYEQVTTLVSDNAAAFINRGDAHQKMGNWMPAKTDYEKALSIEKSGVACQRAAWFKATCPDKSLRDATKALSLINRAIELDGDTTKNLDTLAAAEAAAGNFEVAKSTQKKVIGLANAEVTESEQYQVRLTLYEKGEPYTQTSAAPAGSSKTDKK